MNQQQWAVAPDRPPRGEAWLGADCEQFLAELTTASARLTEALTGAEQAAARLVEQAEQQRSASDSDRWDRIAEDLPPVPAESRDIPAWWQGLSKAEREHVLRTQPFLLGNTDGIPLAIRDRANRVALDSWLPGQDSGALQWTELLKNDDSLLIAFDPRGDGRAVLSMGDPASAQRVVAFIPGIGNDLTTFSSVVSNARALRSDAGTAAIAWLGYDAPPSPTDITRLGDVLSGAGEARAVAGAEEFRHFSSGLGLTPQQQYSVVGHSYGSVVAMYAAHDAGLPTMDNLILVGSPGASPFNSVESLALADDQQLFTLAAPGDFVAGSYGDWIPGHAHGNDALFPAPPVGLAQAVVTTTRYPTDLGFGGVRMSTGGWGEAPLTAEGHSSYFKEGTGSLANIHAVVNGVAPGLLVGDGEDARGVYRGVLGEVRELTLGG